MIGSGLRAASPMDEPRRKGVEFRQFPSEVIGAMRHARAELIDESRRSTPGFGEPWASSGAFHEEYATLIQAATHSA